jgi:hypothetical protein
LRDHDIGCRLDRVDGEMADLIALGSVRFAGHPLHKGKHGEMHAGERLLSCGVDNGAFDICLPGVCLLCDGSVAEKCEKNGNPHQLEYRPKMPARFRERLLDVRERQGIPMETPFDNIESSHEYVQLLTDAIEEALAEIAADIDLAAADRAARRVEALQLVHYKITALNGHMTSSRRILNDLRTLRRLLLDERVVPARKRSVGAD